MTKEEREAKRAASFAKEAARTEEMMRYEREYAACGHIAGIDEVGRGPLAGPVTACCVILPEDHPIYHLNDSKKLSPKKREELYGIILKEALSVGLGEESPAVIDGINILQATYSAMRKAIDACAMKPDLLLVDAVTIPGTDIKQVGIIKGDAKSASIAAASIVAKVTRDRYMEEMDKLYPEYHFASNKGYGTAEHIAALRKYGPCPIHRRSFIGNFCGGE